jgi:hypothetical protein
MAAGGAGPTLGDTHGRCEREENPEAVDRPDEAAEVVDEDAHLPGVEIADRDPLLREQPADAFLTSWTKITYLPTTIAPAAINPAATLAEPGTGPPKTRKTVPSVAAPTIHFQT